MSEDAPDKRSTYVDSLERSEAAAQAEIVSLKQTIRVLEDAKNGAYRERNMLVSALSKLFPSSLERHPAYEEWEDDWRWIVFIDLPTGQASWHIHDSELPLFSHLPHDQNLRVWDGHDTDEKYARLAALKGVV